MKVPAKIKAHPMFTQADYMYFRNKGYTTNEILAFWDRDLSVGMKPVQVNKNETTFIDVVSYFK